MPSIRMLRNQINGQLTGRCSIRAGTAARGSTVCWLGLCIPLPSLAISLFSARPALHVKPVSAVTAARSECSSAQPAASSCSCRSHSASGRCSHAARGASPGSSYPGASQLPHQEAIGNCSSQFKTW